jgi:peroxiredoxin
VLGQENVVLAFFPLAFTGVCTDEMCTFRDQLAQFNDLHAQVYGISVDSPFSLNVFIQQHELTFPLLSDFNREISRSFGVLHEELMGLRDISKRSVFVLDPQGIVRYRWVSDDPGRMPDFAEIRSALGELQP